MQGKRLEKVNSIICEELNWAINHTLAEDFGFISINFVATSKDLKNAKVYLSSFNKSEDLLKQIKKNMSDINKKFIQKVKLRKIPRIEYILDQKQENINRVEELLDKIVKKL